MKVKLSSVELHKKTARAEIILKVNYFQYCLRWTRHPHMLSDALELNKNEISKLSPKVGTEEHPSLNNTPGPLMDLTIYLDDGSLVKLHSVVLAAGSEYFQTLGQVGKMLIYLVFVHKPIFTYLQVPCACIYMYLGAIQVSSDQPRGGGT